MRSRAPILLVVAALAAPVAVLAQDEVYMLSDDRPQLGRSAIGEVVSGRVFVRHSGTRRYRRFRGGAIQMGSYVDATKGRIRLSVSRGPANRRTWRADFYVGKFHLSQQMDSPYVTTLRMVGGDFDACEQKATISAKRKRKRIRRLWGDGKGRFRTRGRHSAATVRGTKWTVEDRCDGTLTYVARGRVDVEDFALGDPAPTPTPTPTAPEGGAGAPASPVAGPQAGDRAAKPRRVRLRRGQRYVARPRS